MYTERPFSGLVCRRTQINKAKKTKTTKKKTEKEKKNNKQLKRQRNKLTAAKRLIAHNTNKNNNILTICMYLHTDYDNTMRTKRFHNTERGRAHR